MKNICLSFLLYISCVHGYTFRDILASLHFNENLHRDAQLTKNGEKYYKVTYPKYKLGEEVVHEVASPPTYCEFNYSTVCSMQYGEAWCNTLFVLIFLCLFFVVGAFENQVCVRYR